MIYGEYVEKHAQFSCQMFTFPPKVNNMLTFVYNDNTNGNDDSNDAENDIMTGIAQLSSSGVLTKIYYA